jgi:hypothetical protein
LAIGQSCVPFAIDIFSSSIVQGKEFKVTVKDCIMKDLTFPLDLQYPEYLGF